MKAAILCVGNEVLLGRTLNSNAAEIGQGLSKLGLEVSETRVILDNVPNIQAALRELALQHEVIIITGGLGPTRDDHTRQAIAELLQQPLVNHPPAETWLRQFYSSRNVPVNDQLLQQTTLPKGAIPCMNPKGSALGFMVGYQKTQFCTLPGVPSEMRAMFNQEVLPKLQQLLAEKGTQPLQLLTCRLIGITESAADKLAEEWVEALQRQGFKKLHWGTQIRFPEVHLIFYAPDAQTAKAFEQIQIFAKTEAPTALIDFDEILPEQKLHDLLIAKGLTLAVAESCTGGYLSSRLLAQPNASTYYLGGTISYANSAKVKPLGVSLQTLEKHGAVSAECALEMATRAAALHGADIGVGITGILGPGGGSYGKPLGTAFVGLVTEKLESLDARQQVSNYQLRRDRLMNREELTVRVLLKLSEFVQTIPNQRRTT